MIEYITEIMSEDIIEERDDVKLNKGFTKIYNRIIEKYEDVIEDYNKDEDGYEIFLKEGYYWGIMGEGVRTLFEYTLNDLSKSVNRGVKKDIK